jgi:hypothetical protein
MAMSVTPHRFQVGVENYRDEDIYPGGVVRIKIEVERR